LHGDWGGDCREGWFAAQVLRLHWPETDLDFSRRYRRERQSAWEYLMTQRSHVETGLSVLEARL
jgi:hypothetical protein